MPTSFATLQSCLGVVAEHPYRRAYTRFAHAPHPAVKSTNHQITALSSVVGGGVKNKW